MLADLYPFLLFLLLLIVWVSFPLLPAWLTFKITPNQTVGLKGPLQGLTVRTTGAFAAYLVIFLIVGTHVQDGISIIGSVAHPAWRVNANVRVLGPDDKPEQLLPEQSIAVTFKPELHTTDNNRILLRIPYDRENWPLVRLQIPSFGGSEAIDLSRMKDSAMEINPFLKTAELKEPITVRRFEGGGFGLAQPNSFQH